MEQEALSVVHGLLLLINLQIYLVRILLVEKLVCGVFTYEESASHQDNDTTIGGGLGVKGRDLVADLLEGQTLWIDIS